MGFLWCAVGELQAAAGILHIRCLRVSVMVLFNNEHVNTIFTANVDVLRQVPGSGCLCPARMSCIVASMPAACYKSHMHAARAPCS